MATVGQNINGYIILRELTIGGFCTSYEAQKGGVSYFMKEYSDPTKRRPEYTSFVENQNRMIPKLKAMGNNIEKIVDSFETECRYYLIKEFIKGVSLKEWIALHTSPIVRWSFAIQMCEIVSAIHKEGIIHQDLKPSQFMVVVDGTNECGFSLILTDFDWAIVDGNAVKKVGTLYYGNIDKDVSLKADTLSLGIILSELLVGRKPHNIDNINIFSSVDEATEYWRNLVMSKDFTEPISISPTNISSDTNDVIIRCLSPKAENRPDTDEIIEVLKLDEKRFRPTTTPISMLSPNLNMSISVNVVKPTPTLGVRMACAKIYKRVPGNIKVMNAVLVTKPNISPIYKSISFHIPPIEMLHRNTVNILNR